MNEDRKPPVCFGEMDVVFPLGDDGLRHSPDTCMACEHRTECLKAAMKKSGGLRVQEERVHRAYTSGMIGFWRRWSKTKYLRQQRKKQG